MKADVVVAKDGSGNFKTITEALKQAPIIDATKVEKGTNKTFVIYIKEGVYEEEVQVEANMWFVMLIGDGPTKTKITGKKNFADGFVLFKTATVCKIFSLAASSQSLFFLLLLHAFKIVEPTYVVHM